MHDRGALRRLLVAGPLHRTEFVELGKGDAGKGRRQRRDLVHDFGRMAVVHLKAHCLAEQDRDLPVRVAVARVITLRTRWMRRSALVKVPSFSRKVEPGRKTWA